MKSAAILCFVALVWTPDGYSQYLAVRGSVPLTPRSDVVVHGTNAFAVGANSFAVVSFSNPQSPAVIGQVSPGAGTISAVALRGSYAYCAGESNGVVVIDISDLEEPDWVRNVQASGPIRDVSVSDTFLAVATNLNVILYGLSDPALPRLLATYGRAANQVTVDASARKIHCAGTTGAFVVSWTVNQGDVNISAFDEFGTNEYTAVALGNTYVNFAQGLQFSALNKTTYSLAGQYGASGEIGAIASGSNYSVFGTSTGSVEYLRQSSATPQFASSVQASGGINGLAISSNEQFILAATSTGVTVIANAPLTTEPTAPLPTKFTLSAYPNPFNSLTTVSWTTSLHLPAILHVYDIQGREVMKSDIESTSRALVVDFSTLAAGNYWVQLRSENIETAPLRLVYLP